MRADLGPIEVVEVVARALYILRRHLATLGGVTLLHTALSQAVIVCAWLVMQPRSPNLLSSALVFANAVGVLVAVTLGFLYMGIMAQLLAGIHFDHPVGLVDAVRSLIRYGRWLLASGLAAGTVACALFLPLSRYLAEINLRQIGGSPPVMDTGTWLAYTGLVVALFFCFFRFSFFFPSVVLEENGPYEAVQRSNDVSRGHESKLLAVGLASGLLSALVYRVVTSILSQWFSTVVVDLVMLVLGAFINLLPLVAFYELYFEIMLRRADFLIPRFIDDLASEGTGSSRAGAQARATAPAVDSLTAARAHFRSALKASRAGTVVAPEQAPVADAAVSEAPGSRQVFEAPPREEVVPPCEEAVPPCEEAVPPCEEAVPPCEEPVPPCEAPAPSCEEVVPPCEEAVPPCEEPVPPCEEAVPPCEEAVPPCEAPAPPREEAVPPCEAPVPACEERVPPCEERVPACEEAVPPCEELVPSCQSVVSVVEEGAGSGEADAIECSDASAGAGSPAPDSSVSLLEVVAALLGPGAAESPGLLEVMDTPRPAEPAEEMPHALVALLAGVLDPDGLGFPGGLPRLEVALAPALSRFDPWVQGMFETARREDATTVGEGDLEKPVAEAHADSSSLEEHTPAAIALADEEPLRAAADAERQPIESRDERVPGLPWLLPADYFEESTHPTAWLQAVADGEAFLLSRAHR